MCRNSVQERSRMKKKIMLFLLAVFLGFALLISAICFFVPKKNQNSRENTTEQQKTEDAAEQTEKEKREQYHFTNLEYIYYINSENETDFEEQAAEYVEKNYKNVQWINALSKYDDDVSSNAGTATFYLQLDDDDNSVILISYDKRKEIFSFAPYKKKIESIEDYGGMPQEKNTMQDDEEEYNEIGTEPIHLGNPQITDQDNSLEAVANEKELSQELLKFLEKEGEERRNFYVASVENTGEKNYKNVQWINALAKFDDDVSSNTGTATFYLQLDDEDNSVVLISYDKKKEIFSFVPYKKQIENIEDYGGMPQEKNTMQDDEEEYNEIGTEPIHLGEPQITDQDNSLEAVANKNELSQELLKFLEKEGEERRNFYVTSVENTGGKNFKAVLDFSTKRSDGKNISITFENGIYTFAFK